MDLNDFYCLNVIPKFKIKTMKKEIEEFDKVYNEIITQNLATFAYKHTYQNLDRGIIELLGPNGISTNIYSIELQPYYNIY